ncbi:PCDP1-like protein [Mya arenaria]|uniref:PCDP1-like protein n=1 Tax=Mya arenaria TaxID=6604 RepID=A0ABY7DE71_MYAAR|nr:PCDP1-like protein [Mya arenaria]
MPAVEAMPRGPMGHQGPMDSSGLLIETMQYEEPVKSQPVPNHLLETKIYTKIAQNAMVMAKPAVIHFGGFEVDKKQTIALSIVNVSTEVIRMHIIPPQTKYFYIKYTKNERLVPGLTLDCTIEFTPDEWRYYYDWGREPVFPLRCEAPIDFEYQITYLQPHQAFSVHPISGIIPANGETEVSVTFSPIEFHTAYMRVQLVISQFNSTPIVCTFTGTSTPGLLKDDTLARHTFYSVGEGEVGFQDSLLDPRSLTPVERARKKKLRISLPPPTNVKQEVEYQGVKFPANLDTPYAVAQVLTQEPGKMRAKDLRDVVVTKDAKPKVATRQMKYKRCGDPVEDEEYVRQCTKCTFRRTLRDKDLLAANDAQFDVYTNDMWHVRHKNLDRFAQAARKSLKHFVADWQQKKYAAQNLTAEQKEKISEEQKRELLPENLELSTDKIKRLTFPTYVPPKVKDDMAPDALGSVPFKSTEVVVKRKVPYFNLKVPLTYKLSGYEAYNVQESSSGYVPVKMSKPLRTGAEDEVISLPSPVLVKEDSVHMTRTSLALGQPGETTRGEPERKPVQQQERVNPAPGLQVFQSPVAYAETDPDFHLCPLPRYTRRDHATNMHASTQRRYLDREDVVRGIMTWKKFPSQGLTSLSNTPTLTNVWVPRWDDPFSSEVLPEDTPALMDCLPAEDGETILEDEEEEGRVTSRASVILTPEMVNAQFILIDPSTPTEEKIPSDAFPHGNRMPATNIPVSGHGPVPREQREEELEQFLTRRYNRLGGKIQSRSVALDGILNDKNLALK